MVSFLSLPVLKKKRKEKKQDVILKDHMVENFCQLKIAVKIMFGNLPSAAFCALRLFIKTDSLTVYNVVVILIVVLC